MNFEQIETLENEYLKLFYHSLQSNLPRILEGLDSKLRIKDDWVDEYGGETGEVSVFDKGAERVIFSYLNTYSQDLKPNSAPVGSDLFFESDKAFIHVDLKTTSASLEFENKNGKKERKGNLGDFKNIPVGNNQNSYKSNIIVRKKLRPYKPSLPYFYNAGTENEKLCLTYFLSLLFDMDTYETLVINIMSLPNGKLYDHYGDRVIQAGKNKGKPRFRLQDSSGIKGVNKFELLNNTPSRILTLYVNENINDPYYLERIEFFRQRLVN